MLEVGERVTIDNMRYYMTPYGLYPSVNVVNSKTPVYRKLLGLPAKSRRDSISASDKARMVLGTSEGATDRGSLIHAMTEAYLSYGELGDLEELITKNDILEYWDALRVELDDVTPIFLERFVSHPVYKYAGTLDIYGRYHNKLSLIDLKTSYTLDVEASLEKWFLQTVAYSAALKHTDKCEIEQNVIIVAFPGQVRVYEIDKVEMLTLWDGWKAKCNHFWEKYPNPVYVEPEPFNLDFENFEIGVC
jgi:CRISPR/Cas system-associated exonuclease Cas4 (RecB family)